ncbi:hypothetical protein [Streptomyces sp. NPDC057854]|uniref:hypothetical protein n=1 Tax=unclassified Streptomyces TaxID=2593676 RepID=UPI0036942793
MAELSYPFNADNANGGSQIVSQTQWQSMARMWAGDRVDFLLTATSYSASALPFSATVVNGRTVQIGPGKAWVGGFYYTLTSTHSVTIASNGTTQARKDLIVLQADMAKSAVNLVVLTGTAAANPIPPTLRRQVGGIWEMPLYEVDAAASNGPVTLSDRMPFDVPGRVAYPWNASPGVSMLPRGTFAVDMDNNNSDTQTEYFVGRTGTEATRDLGKSRSYTPGFVNAVSNVELVNRIGRWRWIAPGTVHFSASITCDWADRGVVLQPGKTQLGLTIPIPASGVTGQVLKGYIRNPNNNGGLPNLIDITATILKSTTDQTVAYLNYPNTASVAEGMDYLRTLPSKSTLTVSGVYEASTFGN